MKAGAIAWRRNALLAALSACALLGVTLWQVGAAPPSPIMQFVAEHGNIASSLVRGGGYSDPFGTPSGPTAWTPPVFACYLAAVFSVLGVKTVASAWALLALDGVWAGTCVLCTLAALDLCGRPALKAWFAAVLVALAWLHSTTLGPTLSTVWFVSALNAAFLMAAAGAHLTGRRAWWWIMAVSAGLQVLTHAGSGAACVAVLLVLGFLAARRGDRAATRRTLAVLGLCAALVGAWTGRNWIVFHQVIPLKSTGWFELYLEEQYTQDGVLDDSVIVAHHPYSNPRLLVDYTVRGESAFLADYRTRARALLAADPGRFGRHVLGRARSVFSYTDTFPHVYLCRADPSPVDGAKLVDADLAARFTDPLPVVWTSLGLSPEEFARRLALAAVSQPNAIARDWLNAKGAMLDGEGTLKFVLSGIALSGLPTACLLLTLALRRLRTDAYFGFCALFYLVAVLPNVLITTYSLHLLHFVGLQALFIVSLGGAFWRSRAPN